VGQTIQLKVTGTMGDGSTADLTSRDAWAVYRTSNPAIATVGKDGLATAVGPGFVSITVVNEAATAVKRLRVAEAIVRTTVAGFVALPDGSPAPGAEVNVPNADRVAADERGAFSVPVTLPAALAAVLVTASHSADAGTMLGCTRVTPVPNGVTDAGIITLGAGSRQAVELRNRSFAEHGYVRIPDHPDFKPDAFTAEAWITPLGRGFAGAGDGGVNIFGKGREGGCCWDLPWSLLYFPVPFGGSPAGALQFCVSASTRTNGTCVNSTRPIPLGSTSHVAVTFDGRQLRIVIDDEVAGETNYGFDRITWGDDDFLIGAGNYIGEARRGFEGVIDEARFWSRARDPDEIAFELALRLSGEEPGLVGYWSFDQGDARDDSGHGHDGAFVGPRIEAVAGRGCVVGE
jgi:hypothetical protein